MPDANKAPFLRARKAELEHQRHPLTAERDRLRAELDAILQTPRVAEIRTRLKAINAELGPIDDELAALARALPGHRGLSIEPGSFTKTEGKS